MTKDNREWWEEEYDRICHKKGMYEIDPIKFKEFLRAVDKKGFERGVRECVGLAEEWVYRYLRDILNVNPENARKVIDEEAHVEGAGDGRVNGAIRVMAYLKSKLTPPQSNE